MITRLNPTACAGLAAAAVGNKTFVSPVEPYRIGSRTGLQHSVYLSRQNPLSVKLHTGRVAQQSALKISAVATIDHSSQPLTPRIPSASQIFDSQHVPHLSPSLLLYFPLGVCLASVRMAMWVILLAADMPWLTDNNLTITVLQKILGLHVVWKNAGSIPAERHVLVSNHVTAGDLMVLYSLPQHYVHLISAQLPKRISRAKHHRVRLWHATKDVYESLAKTPEHSESIHLFPVTTDRIWTVAAVEGGMTNGAGMVRFSRGFMRFGKALPIVPVALKIQLEATVLKPMTLQEGQGNGAFVESVQQAIADQLEIGIADITFQEKKKLIRQYSKAKH